jgi:hypothetical protein
MAPTQRRTQKETAQKSSSQSNSGQSSSQEQKESGSSFLLYLILGFMVLIGYTIWSSIETYSNSMISDMD